MKAALRVLAACGAIMAATAHAADDEGSEASGRRASPATKPSWEFAITAYPTNVRNG